MTFLDHLRASLLQDPPDISGHADYLFAAHRKPANFGAVRAAVLLPIVARNASQGGPALLFTQRTESLARHGGQVSFPGGRCEAHDLNPIETALRETMEETGIAPSFITVAGYLDRYLTGTGFDIQPVVGLLAEGFALAPDPHEVAAVFEVPLAFLLDSGNRRRQTRRIAGQERSFYSFTYGDREIWGATAAIVVNLVQRLHAITSS